MKLRNQEIRMLLGVLFGRCERNELQGMDMLICRRSRGSKTAAFQNNTYRVTDSAMRIQCFD